MRSFFNHAITPASVFCSAGCRGGFANFALFYLSLSICVSVELFWFFFFEVFTINAIKRFISYLCVLSIYFLTYQHISKKNRKQMRFSLFLAFPPVCPLISMHKPLRRSRSHSEILIETVYDLFIAKSLQNLIFWPQNKSWTLRVLSKLIKKIVSFIFHFG